MISGKILKLNGWPDELVRFAKPVAETLEAQGLERDAVLARLATVRAEPGASLSDPLLAVLARECLRVAKGFSDVSNGELPLRDTPLAYPVWGREQIDAHAFAQMDAAMRLPVSIAGALMPDAHPGYALPIGGVLATQGVVIPQAVGVDIACRMRLSLYAVSPILLDQKRSQFSRALMEQTVFGAGGHWEGNRRPVHAIMDDPTWQSLPLLRTLRHRAPGQLGTSGSGNHFVEWGVCELTLPDQHLRLEPGRYLALLSHSGSRGIGFKIAEAYSRLASEAHPDLDSKVQHFAWLELDSEAGQEYWLAMELAGRFASANHEVIHRRVAAAVGLREAAVVENHHNFAWRERLPDGREAIVHRKGATPAGTGVLGVIPGSMADPGFVVRGRGSAASLNSASHGAGRALSRQDALQSVTKPLRDRYLSERGVTLLGGGLDEAPQAYKSIETVIAAQSDLAEVIGRFTPKMVRMADEVGEI